MCEVKSRNAKDGAARTVLNVTHFCWEEICATQTEAHSQDICMYAIPLIPSTILSITEHIFALVCVMQKVTQKVVYR